MHEHLRAWAATLSQVLLDLKSVLEVLDFEITGEVFHFLFHLCICQVKCLYTRSVVECVLSLGLSAISTHGIMSVFIKSDC